MLGDDKRAVIPNLVRNRKIDVDKPRPGDPVENQTFFTKSKILEKVVKQVQGHKNRAVIPNLIRNRKIEVDNHRPCDPETSSG